MPRFQKLLNKYPLSQERNSPFTKIANKFMHVNEFDMLKSMVMDIKGSAPSREILQYTAGIWAIKESILKSISSYVPKEELPPAQKTYTKLIYKKKDKESGAPELVIDRSFPKENSQYANFYYQYFNPDQIKVLLSISHDGEYLVAFSCIIKK